MCAAVQPGVGVRVQLLRPRRQPTTASQDPHIRTQAVLLVLLLDAAAHAGGRLVAALAVTRLLAAPPARAARHAARVQAARPTRRGGALLRARQRDLPHARGEPVRGGVAGTRRQLDPRHARAARAQQQSRPQAGVLAQCGCVACGPGSAAAVSRGDPGGRRGGEQHAEVAAGGQHEHAECVLGAGCAALHDASTPAATRLATLLDHHIDRRVDGN